MKANKIQTLWIILCSVIYTIFISMRTVIASRKKDRSIIDRLIRNWSLRLLKFVRIDNQLNNPHGVNFNSDRPIIIMSNHASLYDIPLIISSIPATIRMIAKIELFNIPIFGHALRYGEFISVDRNNTQQAIKDLELAKEKMKTGVVIWMAPEGTRSRDGHLQRFKKGGFMMALQTDAIIVPVGIRGSFDVLPPKTTQFHLNCKTSVNVGEPIDTRDYDIKSRNKLVADIRGRIAAATGNPEE